VWGTASILPEQCVALHGLHIDDIDLPAARELWTHLWPLCHFLESQSLGGGRDRMRACRQQDRAGTDAAPRPHDAASTELGQLLEESGTTVASARLPETVLAEVRAPACDWSRGNVRGNIQIVHCVRIRKTHRTIWTHRTDLTPGLPG